MSAEQEPAWLSRALAPVTEVKRGEAVTALLLTVNAYLMLTAYYLIKPVREALILVLESGAEYKSYMSGAIAIALLFAVPAYAKVSDRLPRGKLVIGVTLFFALHLLLFLVAALNEGLRSQLGLIFYLWVGIFNMMVVAQFWSFANDIYDPERGKRLFPLIALGATLGAAVGSKIAAALIPLFTNWFSCGSHDPVCATRWWKVSMPSDGKVEFGVFPLLLLAAALLVVCAVLFRLVDAREAERAEERVPSASPAVVPSSPPGAAHVSGAFQIVFAHRYLLLIAAFSLIFSWVNTNGEYLLGKLVKAAALEAVARGEIDKTHVGGYIGAAYGDFFFYVNVLCLLLQTFVVSRLVKKIGLGGAFFVLPVIAFFDAAAVAFLPILAIVRVGKIVENATDYSLNNTLRQMLWLVTTREMKYKAKQAVDTFCVRMGDVSSALLVWVGTTFLALSVRGFALLNVLLVLVWLMLAVAIVREHRRMAN